MQNYKGANWVHEQPIEGGKLSISDNGAIKVTEYTTQGERFCFALTRRQLQMLVNIDVKALIESGEYNALLEQTQLDKAKQRLETQVEKAVKREQLKIQASLDQLRLLGVNVPDNVNK